MKWFKFGLCVWLSTWKFNFLVSYQTKSLWPSGWGLPPFQSNIRSFSWWLRHFYIGFMAGFWYFDTLGLGHKPLVSRQGTTCIFYLLYWSTGLDWMQEACLTPDRPDNLLPSSFQGTKHPRKESIWPYVSLRPISPFFGPSFVPPLRLR